MKLIESFMTYFADKASKRELDVVEVSRLTGHSVKTLNSYVSIGRGPKRRKDGRRVYYLASDVEKYLENKRKKKK